MHKIIKEDISSILDASQIDWEYFEEKSILITGGYGFLASYFVYVFMIFNERVRARNKVCNVTVLGRDLSKAEGKFAHYINDNKLTFLELDIVDVDQLKNKFDIIIHAASLASPKYYSKIPVDVFMPNIVGTWKLLEIARNSGCSKFLFLSSSEVYTGCQDEFLNEHSLGSLDPLDVRSCYSEGKRSGEMMCQSYFKQFNVPIVISRIFHTYGPGLALDDGRLFADLIKNAVCEEDLIINGEGKAIRSYCYISDTIVGLLILLTRGELGSAYNIGNASMTFTSRNLAEMIADLPILKNTNYKVLGTIKEKESRVVPDTQKIYNLGWVPKVSASEGFSRTIKTYLG